MTGKKLNILILSAGRRVELIESFRAEINERGLSSRLLATDLRPDLSAACQVADHAIPMPRVTDSDYLDRLLQLCLDEEIGLVIPTIDTELLGLAQNREKFLGHGIHVVISEAPLIEICRDKRRTADFFSAHEIGIPAIYDRRELLFPCFAKPYDGSRSVGTALLTTEDAVTPLLLSDSKMMFMEYIDGSHDEYTVDAYYDRLGRLGCMVPRQRLEVRDGEISKGITRRHHVYDYLRDKLVQIDGARGCLTLQLFVSPDASRYAALEVNPRFGGGYPLSYAAGANYPGWLIDEYLLEKQIAFFDRWEEDLLMLRYDAKVLVRAQR